MKTVFRAAIAALATVAVTALALPAASDDAPAPRPTAPANAASSPTVPGNTGAAPLAAAPLSPGDETLIAEGKELFTLICVACHAVNGEGLKLLAPPLVKSDWVVGSDARLIRIALNGVSGPIKVNGTVYSPPDVLPEMPPLGALEDRQLAAVLSFVRREWGHQAAVIAPERVKAVRAEVGERQTSWKEAELLEVM